MRVLLSISTALIVFVLSCRNEEQPGQAANEVALAQDARAVLIDSISRDEMDRQSLLPHIPSEQLDYPPRAEVKTGWMEGTYFSGPRCPELRIAITMQTTAEGLSIDSLETDSSALLDSLRREYSSFFDYNDRLERYMPLDSAGTFEVELPAGTYVAWPYSWGKLKLCGTTVGGTRVGGIDVVPDSVALVTIYTVDRFHGRAFIEWEKKYRLRGAGD